MQIRILLILVLFLTGGCGGGDKHLPSSNPPEYDPKKINTLPDSPPIVSSRSAIQPAKLEPPPTTMGVPCERPPKKSAELEEPPVVCGGGSGGSGSAGGSAGSGGERNSATKRPTYVLKFESMIVSSGSRSEPAQSQASGIVRLEANDERLFGTGPRYSGQGTIAYQTGPLPNWNACDPLVRGQGTVPIRVFQAFIHTEDRPSWAAAPEGGSAKIELLYGILGMSQETSTGMHYMLNYQCVPNPPELSPFWSSMFISGRGEVSTMPEHMFLLNDWTYVGQNGMVATKTLRSTCGGMCDQEVSIFTLREESSSGGIPIR
jgi:hypothetical protein